MKAKKVEQLTFKDDDESHVWALFAALAMSAAFVEDAARRADGMLEHYRRRTQAAPRLARSAVVIQLPKRPKRKKRALYQNK